MSNTDLIPIGITATTTFTPVSTLLNSAGLTAILNAPVTSSPGYILNRSASVSLYVGYGTGTAPTAYATLTPLTALKFGAGMNTSLLWIASASSTVACDFVEGGDYQAVTISGVIGTITLSANEMPKGDGSGNLVASVVSSGTAKVYPTTDDGAALGDTTHGFSDIFLATGSVYNVANGNWVMTHTSGIQTVGTGDLRVTNAGTNSASVVTVGGTQTLTAKTLTSPVMTTPTLGVAAATSLATSAATPLLLTNGQLVNVALTSQTVGATTLTIPDFASVVDEFVFKTKSVTMSNKTFVAPVLGVATGTSLAVTGLLRTSSATVGMGYAAGAGSAVTQGTSRTTSVTIDTPTGAITLFSAAGSATPFSFTVTNASVAATDTIIVSQKSGTDIYTTQVVSAVGAGSFRLTLANASGTTTEQPVFNFAVIKAVAA